MRLPWGVTLSLEFSSTELYYHSMIISNHQLTPDHFDQLNALVLRCQQQDGNTIPIYTNVLSQHRNLPCNLLYYHQQQLVGFLSVFFFYDNACELTLMVDPAFRRQHVASQLVATILPVIQSRFLENVISPSPKALNNAWLSARGFIYQNSEVRMQWSGLKPPPSHHSDLSFHQATAEHDIPLLVEIDMACFHSAKRDIEPTYLRLLADKTYVLLIVSKNQQVIGKAHVHYEAKQTVVSDIAILPDHQGHGHGQALVAYCIDYVRSTTSLPLCLDVEADNHNAVHIYDKLGFKTINSCDRWMISLDRLYAAFAA